MWFVARETCKDFSTIKWRLSVLLKVHLIFYDSPEQNKILITRNINVLQENNQFKRKDASMKCSWFGEQPACGTDIVEIKHRSFVAGNAKQAKVSD